MRYVSSRRLQNRALLLMVLPKLLTRPDEALCSAFGANIRRARDPFVAPIRGPLIALQRSLVLGAIIFACTTSIESSCDVFMLLLQYIVNSRRMAHSRVLIKTDTVVFRNRIQSTSECLGIISRSNQFRIHRIQSKHTLRPLFRRLTYRFSQRVVFRR